MKGLRKRDGCERSYHHRSNSGGPDHNAKEFITPLSLTTITRNPSHCEQYGPQAGWRQFPLVRRLWAGLVDLAIVFSVAVLILTALSGLDTAEIVIDPEGLVLLAAITLAYRVPIEARTGQTIGKALMGISVYGPDGGVPGWWRAAARNVIGVLLPLWPIDAVLLLRGRRQRLGDLLTGTTVRRVGD